MDIDTKIRCWYQCQMIGFWIGCVGTILTWNRHMKGSDYVKLPFRAHQPTDTQFLVDAYAYTTSVNLVLIGLGILLFVAFSKRSTPATEAYIIGTMTFWIHFFLSAPAYFTFNVLVFSLMLAYSLTSIHLAAVFLHGLRLQERFLGQGQQREGGVDVAQEGHGHGHGLELDLEAGRPRLRPPNSANSDVCENGNINNFGDGTQGQDDLGRVISSPRTEGQGRVNPRPREYHHHHHGNNGRISRERPQGGMIIPNPMMGQGQRILQHLQSIPEPRRYPRPLLGAGRCRRREI